MIRYEKYSGKSIEQSKISFVFTSFKNNNRLNDMKITVNVTKLHIKHLTKCLRPQFRCDFPILVKLYKQFNIIFCVIKIFIITIVLHPTAMVFCIKR